MKPLHYVVAKKIGGKNILTLHHGMLTNIAVAGPFKREHEARAAKEQIVERGVARYIMDTQRKSGNKKRKK